MTMKASAASQSLLLKVKVKHLGIEKTIKFEPYTTAKEALNIVSAKCNMKTKGDLEDTYSIYVGKGEGYYMENMSMYLQSYGLVGKDVVEIRSIPSTLSVRNVEGKLDSIQADFEMVASELLVRLCNKFHYKDPQSYELFVEGRPEEDALDPSDTLESQFVTEQAVIGLRKRRKAQRTHSIMRFVASPPARTRKEQSKSISERNLSGFETPRSANRLFGVALTDLLENGKKGQIPPFVDTCIARLEDGLSTEGLFRVPGNAAEIEKLKGALNLGEQPPDFLSQTDFHVASGLLKLFFRELPEPIMTYDFYNKFLQIASVTQPLQQIQQLMEMMDLIPLLNRALLQRLFGFLHTVGCNSDQNKMHFHNLGTVFAPNLLKSLNNDPMKIIADNPSINTIATLYIKYGEPLFERTSEFVVTTCRNTAQSDNELSFEAGDVIYVTAKDGDWWTGELDGITGAFLASHVTDSEDFVSNEQSDIEGTSVSSNTSLADSIDASTSASIGNALSLSDKEDSGLLTPISSSLSVPSTLAFGTTTHNNHDTLSLSVPSSSSLSTAVLQNELEKEKAHRIALQQEVKMLVEEVTYLRDVLDSEIKNRIQFEEFVKKELLTIFQKSQEK